MKRKELVEITTKVVVELEEDEDVCNVVLNDLINTLGVDLDWGVSEPVDVDESKWPNNEMGNQCPQWPEGGAAKFDRCANAYITLSPYEKKKFAKEFGLKKVVDKSNH